MMKKDMLRTFLSIGLQLLGEFCEMLKLGTHAGWQDWMEAGQF
jgi:hypothetical protein